MSAPRSSVIAQSPDELESYVHLKEIEEMLAAFKTLVKNMLREGERVMGEVEDGERLRPVSTEAAQSHATKKVLDAVWQRCSKLLRREIDHGKSVGRRHHIFKVGSRSEKRFLHALNTIVDIAKANDFDEDYGSLKRRFIHRNDPQPRAKDA